jgi:hypothetical protein
LTAADNGSVSDERCAGCGRETGAGSPLFAARRRAKYRETGDEVYLCAACVGDLQTQPQRFSNSRLGAFELSDMFRG